MRNGLDELLKGILKDSEGNIPSFMSDLLKQVGNIKACDCLGCKALDAIDNLVGEAVKTKSKDYLDAKALATPVLREQSVKTYTAGALAFAKDQLVLALDAYMTKSIIMKIIKEEQKNG